MKSARPFTQLIPLLIILSIIVLLGCKTDKVDMDGYGKTQLGSYHNNKNSYNPEGKEQFVFNKKANSSREYGYRNFCPTLESSDCAGYRLPYEKYVGMKGYFVSKKPIKKDLSGREYYSVILENGEKFYFVSNKNYGGKYGVISPIIPLEQYKEVISFKPEPLIQGSSLSIVSADVLYGSKYYLLSNGERVLENNLNLIREIVGRFECKSGMAELAELLLGMKLKKDEVENRIFISPTGPNIRSGARVYIGLNAKSQWLRFEVKYSGEKWLFVNSFKVAADDYRWQSPELSFSRDHFEGDVWEWVDVEASEKYVEIAKTIANSEKTIIRFQGAQYYSDLQIEEEQKKDIKTVFRIFELIN